MSTRVLVAGDSDTMRNIITRSLKAVGVPSAVEAANGNEAVQIFIPGHYDLVMADWKTSGKTGWEVTQAIRAEDPNVPIVMITTESERQRVAAAIEDGVTDYLVKPFTDEALQEKLEKHVAVLA